METTYSMVFDSKAEKSLKKMKKKDPPKFAKIKILLKEILQNPFLEEHRAETLKFQSNGKEIEIRRRSIRVNKKDRIVYDVLFQELNGEIIILSVEGHYNDK